MVLSENASQFTVCLRLLCLCRFINGQFDSISAEVVDDNWRIAPMQNSVRQRSLIVAIVIAREEPEWEFCFCGLIWSLG